MLEPVTLSDGRVRLEPLSLEHVAALEAAAADGELWKLVVTTVPAPGGMRAYVEKALAAHAAGDGLPFVVRDLGDGVIVGTTRYYEYAPDVPRVAIGSTWYAASRQHTHINTAAKLLLIDHALGALGCAAIAWHTDILNTRSQRAIERLGATREGVLRAHRRRRDGTLRDTVCYSMLADEWPALRARLAATQR
ncbi:MAG TPA: GNAT family protein [Rhodanobacteraceae bacterium]|nr:GNAT family protein [Rhodanobacteraceae bacterium]